MTIVKTRSDYELVSAAGSVVREVLELLGTMVKEGINTEILDKKAEELILSRGARPAFKGYRGYPSTICASVNEVVVHGIPSREVYIKNGDIVSIDVGVEKEGFFADSAKSFCVGQVSEEVKDLVDTTERCLTEAIEIAKAGSHLGDVSATIQAIAEDRNFSEVRTFVGHGIGRNLHEDPEVPNWGYFGDGLVLEEGLLLAIEPMLNSGTRDVKILDDNWTAVTKDGKLSAHFEHTVIVGKKKAEILT